MKNSNFFEYIDSYNHTTHDLKTLKETIQKTNSGSFYANNFKGENYFFSYAALSNDNGFFVITAIPKTSLNVNYTDWTILTIVFLALIVFLFVNIHYFMRVSEKENQTKELLQKQLHTIQKQENQLQESLSDALKANKSKSTFLFNMSHDIRTPMNAIIGFTDLMLKNLEDTEKLKHYLHKIQVSNEILYSLINNVLELARIESGKIHLENHVWNISELVDLTHTLFDDQMRSKGVNFTISTTVQHSIVYGDYTKIQEIFLNILSNAYKYSNPGGKVSIVIEEIPNENPDYTTHKTVITDTGIGMSAKFLEHIFDEFEREHTSTESKIVGSGLGMSIVKKLIDLMDGEIFVESKEGVGSCFTVILSHRIATKEAWEKSKEMSIIADDIDFHGKRVLLVEDNTLNAEIAISILEEMGFIVEHAEDGLICLDMLRTALPSYYNLILMDIQMPNLDGLETTRKIRMFDDRQKASIPIIAMTANAFEEDRKNCYAAGMNEHLSKPICIPELKALLKKCLSNISIE